MKNRKLDSDNRLGPVPLPGAMVRLSACTASHEAALAALLADAEVLHSLCAGQTHGATPELLLADWIELSSHASMLWVVTAQEETVVGAVRIEHGKLAYFIGRPYWGQGFGRAAVRRAIALIGAEVAIGAVIDRNNLASLRIVEGAGFRFSGLANGLGLGSRLLLYVRRAI